MGDGPAPRIRKAIGAEGGSGMTAENTYDIIVIGAGYGGVTAAAKLSARGFRVLIVDKNKTAGGKAMRIRKDGTSYEMWPIAGGPSSPSRFDELIDLIGLDRDLIIRPKKAADFIYLAPDGSRHHIMLPATGILPFKLFAVGKNFFSLGASSFVGLVKMLGYTVIYPRFLLSRYDSVSMLDFMNKNRLPPPAMALMGMLMNLFFVVPVDHLPASEAIRTTKGIIKGGGGRYHRSGYGIIAEKAVKFVESRGGKYLPATRVEKILIENNKAAGIQTDKGDFRAPVVVSNAGIQPTILKICGREHFDAAYVKKIESLRPSLAFTGVRYHLDQPVFQYPLTVAFSDESWLDEKRFLAFEKGNWPKTPIIFITVPSLYDPSLATREIPQVALIGTISSPDPASPMNETAIEKLEAEVRRLWPDISSHIVKRQTALVRDVSALTRDAVVPGQGGECIGIGQMIGQCGKDKPNPRTPLKGLYIVGCDAGGEGVGTTQAVDSGFNVAELVAKDYLDT